MRYVVMFIACVCVSVCVAHPTQQAGDFPLFGFAMKIRCFLTSLYPEDPLPNCTSSLHRAIQTRQEHQKRKKQRGQMILSALCLPLHMEVIY